MSRDAERAANRARFPEFAAMTDLIPGLRLLWAKDAQGEIGKVPPLPAGCVEIDWTHAALIEADFTGKRGRK